MFVWGGNSNLKTRLALNDIPGRQRNSNRLRLISFHSDVLAPPCHFSRPLDCDALPSVSVDAGAGGALERRYRNMEYSMTISWFFSYPKRSREAFPGYRRW